MEGKQGKGFGFRGWMLFIYQFTAYLTFVVYTNWPMNGLGSMIGPLVGQGPSFVATLYTIAMIVGIIIQIIISRNIGKIKSIKGFSAILGGITMAACIAESIIDPFSAPIPWLIAFCIVCLVGTVWCTFVIGILVGQWFPRRKGTFMGLVTVAFPVGNALMSPFMANVFNPQIGMFKAFLPYLIICLVGYIIGMIFVTDFPEQCGAYRDNDKSVTPEVAMKMMEFEIENRKTTVWTLKNTFKSFSFWCISISCGLLLMFSVGMMTQTTSIFGSVGIAVGSQEFTLVMLGVSAAACVGSYVLGLIDTKIGTRKAMIIAHIFMLIAGIIGMIPGKVPVIASMIDLGIFMGASSNFTVSASVQYWRIEDFPSVFARVNPIANLIQAFAPMLVAMLLNAFGYKFDFLAAIIAAVISLILLFIFKPSMVKKDDDKYRLEAGKPLDDVLVGRK